MSILSEIIDRLQAAFPINRVVVLLLPFYAAAAGAVSAYLVEHLPYLADLFTEDQLTAIFVAVTATALAAGYKWIDGWQKHEANQVDTADLEVALREPLPEDEGTV